MACENCPNREQNAPDEMRIRSGQAFVLLKDSGEIEYWAVETGGSKFHHGIAGAGLVAVVHSDLKERIDSCRQPNVSTEPRDGLLGRIGVNRSVVSCAAFDFDASSAEAVLINFDPRRSN